MSARTLQQLVGALAVLVIVWIGTTLIRSGGGGSIAASGDLGGFFRSIDGASLEAVRVERAGSEVVLERSGSGWTVNGFPADSGAVARLLSALDEMEVAELVASNPANHDRMGVSADSAWSVTFTASGAERTLLVGESGRRFGTAYVRLPDRDAVHLLEGDLRAQVSRGLEAWRDRTIVAVDTARAAELEVVRGGDAYTLVRSDSTWSFADGGVVEESVVRGILTELARLSAAGFLAEGDSVAGLPEAASTTVRSASGDELARVSFGAGESGRWARSSERPYLYRVTTFRVDRVAPERETVAPGG